MIRRQYVRRESIPVLGVKQVQRFTKKYKVSTTEFYNGEPCWDWTGTRCRGYGQFTIDKVHYPAHRVSYAHHIGPLEPERDADHKCGNRGCVNPKHLEEVTRGTNLERRPKYKSRSPNATHCRNNHELTPENTYLYNGSRRCQTCLREHNASMKKQKKVS